jgi:hypothetical protein
MDSEPVRTEPSSGDEELLRDIREDYSYFRDFWSENHDEAKTDLKYISGDPWDKDARQEREDNNRPVLSPDELSQYQNATINNLRQNKRAIKVNPLGSGATDKDAEHRAAIIRGIEYKSNAQSAYTNAFENEINCGFGFFRVTTKTVKGGDGDVEPRIKQIDNPLSVLLDPNAREADFSDMKRCFVMDIMRKRDFEKKYPKAQKRSFSAEDMTTAPDWFQGENILIAEYWRIDGYDEDGNGGKVTQYITNGLEILETNAWPGSWIPIIAALGKKVYKPVGSGMKLFYYSQIRLARGPQMMLAYIASQEAEEFGMAPRAPFVGYVGQFETDADASATVNKVPRAFLMVDPIVDASSGQILPLPTRPSFIPNAEAYEISKESWRRSVQASMGITPLPTSAQRQNEKSGVALDKIQSQQAIGSFHFTDNFDRAIENAGRQLNELITKVMDTPRQVGTRQPDESHTLMHVIPGGQLPPPEDGQQPVSPGDVFDPQKGDFDVTISTGMSYQSQREEASSFVDTLISEMANLPIPPQAKATLLARAISLKDIGPIGDEMAKIIDPQGDGEPVPPQAQQMIAKLQQELQAINAAAQQHEATIQQMTAEKQAKVVEQQGKLAQIAAKSQADMALEDKKLFAQLTIAEVNTKAQNKADREEDRRALEAQFHDQAHDVAMAAQGHQQAQDMQAQQADAQSQQSAQDAQQSQAAQQGQFQHMAQNASGHTIGSNDGQNWQDAQTGEPINAQ